MIGLLGTSPLALIRISFYKGVILENAEAVTPLLMLSASGDSGSVLSQTTQMTNILPSRYPASTQQSGRGTYQSLNISGWLRSFPAADKPSAHLLDPAC